MWQNVGQLFLHETVSDEMHDFRWFFFYFYSLLVDRQSFTRIELHTEIFRYARLYAIKLLFIEDNSFSVAAHR